MWLSKRNFAIASMLLAASAAVAQPIQKSADPFAAHNSPREDLRKKIFSANIDKPDCSVVVRRLSDELVPVDSSLKTFLDTLLQGLREKKPSLLKPLFHPRLKVKDAQTENIFQTIGSSVVEPWEFSVYRMWAINLPGGKSADISCENGDVELTPHINYPLQFGLWLQIMGRNELGRIYLSIVPDPKGTWRIGAFHIHQWTHLGKDPQAWAELAQLDEKSGTKLPAYLKYDIAAKLSNVSYFVQTKLKQQIVAARDALYSKDRLLVEMQKLYKDFPISYVDSVLASDGAGMVFRIIVKGEESAVQLKELCMKLGKQFYSDPVNRKSLGGLRCSYALPLEKPEQEGILGGRFFAKTEFLKIP